MAEVVALVDYGAGNLHSVENALRRVGANVTVTADPDVLRAADRIAAPLLVVHGEHDTNVPLAQALAIHAALAGRGAPVELLRIPDEGHEVHDRHTRAAANARIVEFVTATVARG